MSSDTQHVIWIIFSFKANDRISIMYYTIIIISVIILLPLQNSQL